MLIEAEESRKTLDHTEKMERNNEYPNDHCIPLFPEKEPTPRATELAAFMVKVKAGTGNNAATYKLHLEWFGSHNATPYKWIKTRKQIEEIWTQNSVTAASDKAATMRSILRDEHLSTFNMEWKWRRRQVATQQPSKRSKPH